MRRIALETHGYTADTYARDILLEDLSATEADDDGLRNLADLMEFSAHWASATSNAQLAEDYLELFNGDVDLARAIDMYRRFADETLRIAQRYPTVVRRFLS